MYSRLGLLASLIVLLSMLVLRAIYSKIKTRMTRRIDAPPHWEAALALDHSHRA
jgi:hypothetical protein